MTHYEKLMERVQETCKQREYLLKESLNTFQWVKDNKEKLEALGVSMTCLGDYIDFDDPSREQVLDIIRTFPGTWNKDPIINCENPGLVYTRTTTSPYLRIWNAPVLDTCKVEEYFEEIPAKTVKRFRINCKPEAPNASV